MFSRGIDFGGGRSALISPEQANPLAAILYQQVLGDSIVQALRRGVPRSRKGAVRKERLVLLLRPESPMLLRLVSLLAKLAVSQNETLRLAAVEYPIRPFSLEVAERSDIAIYESLPNVDREPGIWHHFDGQEGVFHWCFVSLSGIHLDQGSFDYWVREILGRYLAPGGIGVVYTALNQPLSVEDNELSPGLAEHANSWGAHDFAKSEMQLTADELVRIVCEADFRVRGFRKTHLVVDEKKIRGRVQQAASLLLPLHVDEEQWADWLMTETLPETFCLTIQKE